MNGNHLYVVEGASSLVAKRIREELAQRGGEVRTTGDLGGAGAVLILGFGSSGNAGIRKIAEAHERGLPIRAAILSDAEAGPTALLRLREEPFDFRLDFPQAFEKLWRWLRGLGLTPSGRGVHALLPPPELFISYQDADRAFVASLHNQLRIIGWSGWHYHGEKRDYDSPSFMIELERNLRNAIGVIFVLSPQWLGSKYCRWEWRKAEDLRKKQVHLRLRPFEDTPGLSERLHIDIADTSIPWFPRLEKALAQWFI